MSEDYFPWSEEAEEAYEQFAYERDLRLHNEIMAKIDAEGGDVSLEIEDAKLAEKQGETLTSEQQSLLDGIRKRL